MIIYELPWCVRFGLRGMNQIGFAAVLLGKGHLGPGSVGNVSSETEKGSQ